MKRNVNNEIFKDLMRMVYVLKQDTGEVFKVVYDFVEYGRFKLTDEQLNFFGGKSNMKVVSKPNNSFKRDRENGIYTTILNGDRKVF